MVIVYRPTDFLLRFTCDSVGLVVCLRACCLRELIVLIVLLVCLWLNPIGGLVSLLVVCLFVCWFGLFGCDMM